jgi:hypothetical protein
VFVTVPVRWVGAAIDPATVEVEEIVPVMYGIVEAVTVPMTTEVEATRPVKDVFAVSAPVTDDVLAIV